MEPITPLSYEFFKIKNLVEHIWIMATNYATNWQALPFSQKYYGFARQLFVKRICTTWHLSCLAFDYINRIKKFYKLNSGENNLEDVAELDFLKHIDPDFMIIDDGNQLFYFLVL